MSSKRPEDFVLSAVDATKTPRNWELQYRAHFSCTEPTLKIIEAAYDKKQGPYQDVLPQEAKYWEYDGGCEMGDVSWFELASDEPFDQDILNQLGTNIAQLDEAFRVVTQGTKAANIRK